MKGTQTVTIDGETWTRIGHDGVTRLKPAEVLALRRGLRARSVGHLFAGLAARPTVARGVLAAFADEKGTR